MLLAIKKSFENGYLKLNLSAEAVNEHSGTVEIDTLYVRRHHQRLGLGRQLLESAEAAALAAGHDKIFLTVFEGNDRAVAFYEAQGMKQSGRWMFEFKGGSAPNLVLIKTLG